MSKDEGFTTLEVLVALGIVAVIAAVAVPSYLAWRSNTQLRGAVERFRGDLQLAKSQAMRDAQMVIVKLKSDKYRIFVDTGNGSGGLPNGKYDKTEPIVCERHMPAGIQIKLVDPTVSDSDGDEDLPSTVGGNETLGVFQPSEGRGGGRAGGLLRAPTGASSGTPGSGSVNSKNSSPQSTDNPNHIRFDRLGRCLNPQNLLLKNTRGNRQLVAINAVGNVRVIYAD